MPEDQREKILAQPSAMKEVYGPDQDTVNSHTIVRGPDGWHLFYGPGPGGHNFLKKHATSDDLVVWTQAGARTAPRRIRGTATTRRSARRAS